MNALITLSSKGQVVIPKDIRDALRLRAGAKLGVSLRGQRIVLEAPEPQPEKISYEEFRRRVPRHDGPGLTVEEMDLAVNAMIGKMDRP